MARSKVYCENCTYLLTTEDIYGCNAPDNVERKAKSTWLKEITTSLKRDREPDIINRNNDCKWYSGRGGGPQCPA